MVRGIPSDLKEHLVRLTSARHQIELRKQALFRKPGSDPNRCDKLPHMLNMNLTQRVIGVRHQITIGY
jgi:hypothetical protein